LALTSNEFRPAIADNSKHDEYLTATWWCLLTILTGLAAQYEDVPGSYCMAITVTDDIAMALGQERFVFPKKLAQIQLGQAGSETVGLVERNGGAFSSSSLAMTSKQWMRA